jgi:beta-glucanase (GH16 family)
MFLKQKILLLLTLSIFIVSAYACSGGNESDIDNPIDPIDNVQKIIPTNLTMTVVLTGADASNLNGDGSGEITVNASATNAATYSIRFGNGDVIENTTGTATYNYKEKGTNSQTISVFAFSSTGDFISISEHIQLLVTSTLIWSDEFDTNGTPNTNNWVFETGNGSGGWGNNEKQYYTGRSDNAIVEDGFLKITAKRENYQGYEFTSARMKTQGKFSFTYGEVEVRAKLPKGSGTWPAIWMLGDNITSVSWPACGEIDIMEHVGNRVGYISSAIHNSSGFAGTYYGDEQFKADVTDEFHVYGIEWTEEKIIFKVDGIEHFTYHPSTYNDSTWPFYRNQFLLLNIATGGNLGGDISNSFSEGTMEIDYVRVYQ